jgi:Rv2525c-like, glycoside hydrolase-like domain
MRTMLDAFSLPHELPKVDAIAGYLPSSGTLADWTPDEWARARAGARFIVPIYVAPAGQDAVAGKAHGAQAAHDSANLGVPKGCVIVLDLEQNRVKHDVESGYAKAWVTEVSELGYRPVIYTSASSKPLVKGLAELWLASWGKPPALLPDSVATQYEGGEGHSYDLSVVADTLPLAPTHEGGNPVETPSNAAMVGIVRTKSGNGYWQFNEDGAVFAFGDAHYHGGANKPDVSAYVIVGMASTPDDGGYWLTASDGGVFAYGNAKFHGAVVGGKVKNP